MRNVWSLLLALLVLLGGLSLTSFSDNATGKESKPNNLMYTPHAPCRINNNAEFATSPCKTGGSGTQGDPYIIEGWDINGTGKGYALYIANTSVYFLVKNNYFHHSSGGNVEPYYTNSGLILSNLQNGRVEYNNASETDQDGIDLGKVKNTVIINNYAAQNIGAGISIANSENVTAEKNNATRNSQGISSMGSKNINIQNNNATANSLACIELHESSFNNLTGNAMHNCGIVLFGRDIKSWNAHYIDTSNLIDGRPVLYVKNRDGGTVPNNIGQAILANTTHTIVSNLNVYDTTYGVTLGFSSNVTIANNTFTGNRHGIHLDFSSNIFIDNNSISNSYEDGIFLLSSNNNTIRNNSIFNNIIGITLALTLNNTITNNILNINGVEIAGSLIKYWNSHTIDTNNKVNGKPLYYYRNRVGGSVPNDAGQVILANVTKMTVQNLSIDNASFGVSLGFSSDNIIATNLLAYNQVMGLELLSSKFNKIRSNIIRDNSKKGILLATSSNNDIVNNTVMNNTILQNSPYNENDAGIHLYGSDNSNISGNYISNNSNGILLWSSFYCYITENIIVNNSYYGVTALYSHFSQIYGNEFLSNNMGKKQGYDEDTDNSWNSTIKGNHWNDYDEPSEGCFDISPKDGFCDSPYIIDGKSNAKDYYPITHITILPPTEPQNLTGVPSDRKVNLSWEVPKNNGGAPITNYTIYRNGTLHIKLGNVLSYNDAGLTNGVSYKYRVTATNVVGEGLPSKEVSVIPHGISPSIIDTIPKNGSTNVSLNSNIVITFSDAMDHALTQGAISASPSISGSFYWDGTSKIITWNPTADFQQNRQYIITISTSAKSQIGESLQYPYSFSFMTGSTTGPIPPNVKSTSPIDGATAVPLNTKISIMFDKAMNHTSTEDAISSVPTIGWYIQWTSADTGITLTPSQPLMPNTKYTLIVDNTARSFEGLNLQTQFQFSFTTGTTVDIIPPSVVATTPNDGQENVEKDVKIIITFSEAMDTVATENAVSISPGAIVDKTWSDGNKNITLSVQLEEGKTYTITISIGAKDLAGNAMTSKYTFFFITKSSNVPVPTGGIDPIFLTMIVMLVIVVVIIVLLWLKKRKKTNNIPNKEQPPERNPK